MAKQDYAFQTSYVKDAARAMLIGRIVNKCSSLSGSIQLLTLPGLMPVFETSLLSSLAHKTLHFDMLEYDAEVADQLEKNANHYDIPGQVYAISDSEYLRRSVKKYDVAWLDWCGHWSPTRPGILKQLVCHNLNYRKNSPPLLGITVAEGREQNLAGLIALSREHSGYRSIEKLSFMARIGGIPEYMNTELSKLGFSLRPDLILRYRDQSGKKYKARTMLMFLFSVFNENKKFDVWNPDVIDLLADQASRMADGHKQR